MSGDGIERVRLDDFNTIPSALVPVDGTELGKLLDGVEVFLRRYVVLDEAKATAISLWTAHTHAIGAAQATPYLFVTSAEPESGKTRLLEVLHGLVPEPLLTMNISDAALFRAIHSKQPVVFFDEVDSIFSPKARERAFRADLQALLNAGYRRGQLVIRMGGANRTTLETFRVFGPKALAGLGTLPPTLASRCIRIELKRRRLTEPVEDFYPDDVADEAKQLRENLTRWAAVAIDALRAARPVRVEGVRDRTMEVWRPLLAIAELAGGPWSARARRAVVGLTGGEEDDPSLGLLLLDDLRTVFRERDAERLSTADVILYLARLEESPWGEWWIDPKTEAPSRTAPRRLAQLLRPYGISPGNVRVDENVARGYKREDFFDAWERFLPPRPSATSATSATSLSHSQADVADVADVADTREGEWLARDGVWRVLADEPPAFPGEVVETRHGRSAP
jgi:hypothetical protein